MKKLAKKLIIVLASVMLAAFSLTSLVGCGASRYTKDGKLIVRYWSIFPSGDDNYAWQMAKIADFEEKNPDIKISHVGTSFWDYFTRLETGMEDTRNGPDIFFEDMAIMKSRAKGQRILNLSPFIENAGFGPDDFDPKDLEVCSYNGGIYGVPFSLHCRVLYLNQDHLNELKTNTDAVNKYPDLIKNDGSGDVRVPETYDELYDYSMWLRKFDNKNKLTRLGFDSEIGNSGFINFVWTHGGECFDPDQKPIVNTNPGVKSGVEEWKRFYNTDILSERNGLFQSGTSAGSTEDLFYSEQVSMMIATSEVAWINENMNKGINLAVTNIPYEVENRANFSGGFSLEINKRIANTENGKVAEAAFKFLEYMMSDDVQNSMPDEIGWLPGFKTNVEKITQSETNPVKAAVLNEMQYRRHWDFIEKYPNWWGSFFNYLSDYAAGKSASSTSQKFLDNVQNHIRAKIAIW